MRDKAAADHAQKKKDLATRKQVLRLLQLLPRLPS